jgi:hypothetical protein
VLLQGKLLHGLLIVVHIHPSYLNISHRPIMSG